MYQLWKKSTLIAGLFAGAILVSSLAAQDNPAPLRPLNTSRTAAPATNRPPRHVSPYRAVGYSTHAKNFYRLKWGIEPEGVKQVSSGSMIRFSYRVVDAEKAKVLNDKKNAPYLIDPQSHVKLVIPNMEKVGQLRQTASPEVGKVYWMVFSNKEGFVRAGDRIGVVIGNFHIDGLVVE